MLQLILISCIALISNVVGMLSGFGLGTIMTPVLLLFLPYQQVLLLVCVIHWFHNIWKVMFFGSSIDWRLFMSFGVPTVLASIVGAWMVVSSTQEHLSALLGAFLVGYVVILFFTPTFKIKKSITTGVIGGALSGFSAGIFGIRGALRGMFLSAYDLKKASYIGTIGAISVILDSTRLVAYFFEGIRLESKLLWGLVIFVPVSFLGSLIGKYFLYKVPQDQFQNIIAVFLFLIGMKLLLTPWL